MVVQQHNFGSSECCMNIFKDMHAYIREGALIQMATGAIAHMPPQKYFHFPQISSTCSATIAALKHTSLLFIHIAHWRMLVREAFKLTSFFTHM